jgi:alpha-N-arabinofuranosidase
MKQVSYFFKIVLGLFCALMFFGGTTQANNRKLLYDTTVNITVNAAKVTGIVNKNIYGYLLEHIYHSINGGLWGEMLASRSFEPAGSKGWYLNNDEVVSGGTRTSSLLFGESSWTDYELTGEVLWEPYFVGVPAPWSGGQSDIRILFRNAPDSSAYALHINAADPNPFSIEKVKVKKNGVTPIVLKAAGVNTGSMVTSRQWHRFRIICKGPEITVFIDNNQVLNYTDRQNPILKGNAGLYLTKTVGRFKNLQVKSLDGKMLWNSLPDEVKPTAIAPDWLLFGHGKFELTKGNTVNGNYTQKVTVENGEGGIKQNVFNLKVNENYNGSLWMHGNKALKLFVRFQDGNKILAETALGPVNLNWKKYKFTLKPSVASPKGEFVIYARGTGSVYIDQASLMPQEDEKIGGYRPDLYKALADLQPTHLRWPGGSYASGYHWKWGIGPQENRVRLPKPSWDYR